MNHEIHQIHEKSWKKHFYSKNKSLLFLNFSGGGWQRRMAKKRICFS